MKHILMILSWISLVFPLSGQEREVIQVGVMEEPPFVIRDFGREYTGLSVDLWRSIADAQGIPYDIVEYSDHLGLIRALDFEEIDISINPIHVNEIRLKMLDLTQPFFVSAIGVASTQVKSSQVGIFIRNFFSLEFMRVVLLLVLVIFVFGFFLWLAERKHNRQQFRPGLTGLFDGLWWSAVTMTTVGYGDKAPKSQLGRIIAMIWMFTAIIIISGFTASIASTLTVNSLSLNIEDLEDLRGSKRIGTVYGSSSEDFLSINEIPIARQYGGAEEALRALARQEIEVLLYDKPVLDYFINRLQLGNRVSLLPIDFNKQYRSFFLPRNSPHLKWVNPLLVRKINEASWQETLQRYNLHRE